MGGGAWVLPPLAALAAAGSDADGFALSKRFLLATGCQVALTNTAALVLAALLRGSSGLDPTAAARIEWLGRTGLAAAACAAVLLETRDW